MDIPERITQVQERIAAAAQSAGRQAEDVQLLLATKTVPAATIRIAIESGSTLIGENRVQEFIEKAEDLSSIAHESHFIGHLQRNKINQVLRYVSCVQSVDRLDLAEALSARVPDPSSPLEVFIQVNTSAEESKFGAAPESGATLAAQVNELPGLNVRGFMTIGLFSSDEVAVRRCYQTLRTVRDEAVTTMGVSGARELSMGMSGDFEWAVLEGSTMVRVGTAIFGQRSTADSFYWPESSKQG